MRVCGPLGHLKHRYKCLHYNVDIKNLKDYSILHYLETQGVQVKFCGAFYLCSSPFSRDSNWSCAIYDTNSYYCWSTGKHGDIIDLVAHYNNCSLGKAMRLLENVLKLRKHSPDDFKQKRNVSKYNFKYLDFLNRDEEEVKAIFNYAKSRRISTGFLPGWYSASVTSESDVLHTVRRPAIMFLHVDENLMVTGAKFRNVDNSLSPRFSARGLLGFYILETNIEKEYGKKEIWLCESETSANSLYEYFLEINKGAVVISMGGVSSAPKRLPFVFDGLSINLIIDYDGNEVDYNKRLEPYEHLGARPIKLILPKGEDINSLYIKNKMYLIEHLLK